MVALWAVMYTIPLSTLTAVARAAVTMTVKTVPRTPIVQEGVRIK
jgi:hypothetical protein